MVKKGREESYLVDDVCPALVRYSRLPAEKHVELREQRNFKVDDDIAKYDTLAPVIQHWGEKELRFRLVLTAGRGLYQIHEHFGKMDLDSANPTEGNDFFLDDGCFEKVEALRQEQSHKRIWIAIISPEFRRPPHPRWGDFGEEILFFYLDDTQRSLSLVSEIRIYDWDTRCYVLAVEKSSRIISSS